MPIYLYENLDMVPGQNGEYIKAFTERYMPLNDQYDTEFLQLSGIFMPDILNSTQPRLVILWTIPSWQAWGKRNFARDPVETLRKNTEFYHPALAWRTGWTDRILEPLPFSPLPAVRPATVRPGAGVFDHQYQVKPEHGADFVEVFQEDVIPASAEAGLTLELVARCAGRPFEFVALWSLPGKLEFAEWHDRRAVDATAYGIPGLERALPYLHDLNERELSAFPVSPLGGRQPTSDTQAGLNPI